MSKFIFSTMTGGVNYTEYVKAAPDQLPLAAVSVFIEGGANLASRQLLTPKGVMTMVTDEQYEILKRVPVFQTHVDGGFITVEDDDYEIEDVVRDMKPKDKSAPATPESFKKGAAPTTGDPDQREAQQEVNASQTAVPATAPVSKPEKTEPKTPKRRARRSRTEASE